MVPPPSGEQFEIVSGAHRAVLVEVGGGIREYWHGDRAVLDGYGTDEMCSGARGTPLVPWPNRLADGRYTFDGATHQAALTEPKAQNAIHGLARWRSWSARERSADRITLGIVLHPMTGYPFTLDVAIDYRVGPEGLTVTTNATNLGDVPCPFGSGQHPYLAAGDGLVDELTCELAARTWIPTDDRGLPAGREEVAGSEFDFRSGRAIGTTRLDHAFTDLDRDGDGLAWVRLGSSAGPVTAVWLDDHYRYVQLFSGDTLGPDHRRRGLAVEPMTCPANGFNSGDGLVRLEPGQTFSTRWGIQPG
ncbi:MAG TPA: aldose 1-epimerase family protein [Pseudonocardia sp.]|jgi:aldose 1-epimerase|nr:aldose 1-epimerase family protein [Pseudonocardia sp.]